MNLVKNFGYVVLFISVLILELLFGILTEFTNFKILPFLILLFFISSKRFSNSFVYAYFFSGIYYDLFYTSNYFGTTSAKYITLGIIINYIYSNLNSSVYSEYLTFLLAVLIYNYEIIFYSPSVNSIVIILSISIINYFLFKLINITLKRDVFKKSI